jgi:predicted DNA-binding antitoxin AbrB/MazE fold protein
VFRIDAIYQDGVFKPLAPVPLPENQRVRLKIELLEAPDALGRFEDLADIKAAAKGETPIPWEEARQQL